MSWELRRIKAWMVATQGESISISSRALALSAKKSATDRGNVINVGWYRVSKAAPKAHLFARSAVNNLVASKKGLHSISQGLRVVRCALKLVMACWLRFLEHDTIHNMA